MGQKKDDTQTIPLCPLHHRVGKESFHEGRKYFVETFGSETYLFEQVQKCLTNDT